MNKNDLMSQMTAILEEVKEDTQEALTRGYRVVAKNTPQKLKNNSPAKTGDYRKGWKSKTSKDGVIVYNATAPHLTHLLENGHIVKNKKGEFGRAPAKKHIAPVDEEEQQEFFETVINNI